MNIPSPDVPGRVPGRVVKVTAVSSKPAPVPHPNSYCCQLPSCANGTGYAFNGNVSRTACATHCEQLDCPCYDYIEHVAHPGFSQCRVVAGGKKFKLNPSASGETAYTTAPVPAPPPPAPPGLQTQVVLTTQAPPQVAEQRWMLWFLRKTKLSVTLNAALVCLSLIHY